MRDLSRLMRSDTEKLGFSLQLKNDDALNEWNINLFGFSDCPLADVRAADVLRCRVLRCYYCCPLSCPRIDHPFFLKVVLTYWVLFFYFRVVVTHS